MADKIIISNSNNLESIKKKISIGGVEKFQVLADFDRTITRAFVAGEEVPSIISVLSSEGYLTSDYPKQAQALFDIYHPIELDPQLPREAKRQAMRQWWSRHFELLIASRLNLADIEQVVASSKLQLRSGAEELFGYLHSRQIPLVIMSSGGLGVESISLFLKKHNLLSDKIEIISNEFIWDSDGYAKGVKEPIIHVMNKNDTMLQDFPFYEKIKDRKNVLLLGDNPDDIEMITGFAYDNLLKIGFLNKRIEENIKLYQQRYDVVITGDEDMFFILDLLKELFD